MNLGESMDGPRLSAGSKGRWTRYALLFLLAEKVVQHVVVTLALTFNWGEIASTLAVPPAALAALGFIVALLFGISLCGMVVRKRWAPALIIGLALFDIVGEFVAQGTMIIAITVSFLVAAIILVLAIRYLSSQAGEGAAQQLADADPAGRRIE